jgi:hypothetical protein
MTYVEANRLISDLEDVKYIDLLTVPAKTLLEVVKLMVEQERKDCAEVASGHYARHDGYCRDSDGGDVGYSEECHEGEEIAREILKRT